MANSDVIKLSERIKAVRLGFGLSQTAFAAKFGINKRTYQRLESGDTSKLECSSLAALANAGVDLEWLITGKEGTQLPNTASMMPDWLGALFPLLDSLDQKGRAELSGWVKGYLSAQAPSREPKGRSKKAG